MKKVIRFLIMLVIFPTLYPLLAIISAVLEWLEDDPDWKFFLTIFNTPIKWLTFK